MEAAEEERARNAVRFVDGDAREQVILGVNQAHHTFLRHNMACNLWCRARNNKKLFARKCALLPAEASIQDVVTSQLTLCHAGQDSGMYEAAFGRFGLKLHVAVRVYGRLSVPSSR